MANTKGMTPNEIGRSDPKRMDKLEKIQMERDVRQMVNDNQSKNQAYYAKNKADAAKKEAAKDYEAFGSRGDAARTGMEEGKMNPAGDTYKKGGAVKCKIDGIALRGKTRAK
jgi:hypothetical protein